jgi:signal transduction histidine kinase
MPALHALIVEDSPDDAALLLRELQRGGYEATFEQVQTAPDMQAALANDDWDIIFCDWAMPRFNAPEALGVARDHGVDIPFIIVSGTINDEVAVTALRNGAHDVFQKGRLTLLVPAVERELREAAMRRERTDMQEQLSISERLASVGLLAAGVAHEINNPLSLVLGSLELARRRLDQLQTDQVEKSALGHVVDELDAANTAAERIRDVASDLRLFARSNDEEHGPVDIERVIRSSLRMAQTEIRHRAHLRLDFTPVPLIDANESRLGQVFLNLLMNAAQSIDEGRAEDNEIAVSTRLDEDGRVVAEVRDSGCGIAPEHRRRLFTPFFTTKPMGEGTGLGLSICHRIVTGFGGTISVESEPGEGSTFTVVLPAIPSATMSPASAAVEEPPAARRGSVLVIDDEPGIGLLIRKVVERDHDVMVTTSAVEALDWITAGRRYDLILCDLMMPHMTGMDFFEKLVHIDPGQAQETVFLTGGAFTPRARQFLVEMDNRCIEKPFDIADLHAMVNDHIG